jgi:hypothetical protein
MTRHAEGAGELAETLKHFSKLTRSYGPRLFPDYDVSALPWTDNDLEQLFGSHRYHERRSSGRKVASPGRVVRGSVRLPAAVASWLRGELQAEGPGAARPARVAATGGRLGATAGAPGPRLALPPRPGRLSQKP